MRDWNDIPAFMKNDRVREYYDILKKHEKELKLKRICDIIFGLVLFVLLLPIMICIGIAVKLDSKGPALFRQTRITAYGKRFKIYKFRTRCAGKRSGSETQVTARDDARITGIGKKLRRYRLDELPQLWNIIKGDMTFVGTRPEVEKYVRQYADEMKATLLIPAGVTSRASIEYKDEEELLAGVEDVEEAYIQKILPEKMKYNLEALRHYSFLSDVRTLIQTVGAVIR